MISYFGILTIGATPVQVSSYLARANKIFVQHAPGNTGNFKVGGNSQLTMAINTPGIYVAPLATGVTNPDSSVPAGGSWSVQASSKDNDIVVNQYFFQGSHSGDVLMWEIHVAN